MRAPYAPFAFEPFPLRRVPRDKRNPGGDDSVFRWVRCHVFDAHVPGKVVHVGTVLVPGETKILKGKWRVMKCERCGEEFSEKVK